MVWVSQKRKIANIKKKIDRIAKKGRDNFQEWYNFVGDSVTRKQYADLVQTLYYEYDFDASKFLSVNDMRESAWESILFLTKDSLQEKKSTLMENLSLYQIGLTYFKEISLTASTQLGNIEEIDYYEENIIGLSQDEYQKIIKNKKTYLLVTIDGSTQSMSFSTWSTQSSYDKNMIELYKSAFDYII